ncbi:hypothetical protein BVY01_03175 [bacterium I07]|nr:hypothetical protein BVY01_03175 [bacterium I07]
MNLSDIQSLLKAEILHGETSLNIDIKEVMVSDLMSDVLAYCCSGALLVTSLMNAQSIRTAEVADLCAIVYARGKKPAKETIDLAKQRDIPLLSTSLPLYDACGILYEAGLPGIHKQT